MNHDTFMHRALQLAEGGRGKTGINPMVGAVLVRSGTIIAEGFHEEFGKAHAERQLLEKFDQKIDSSDILYVNLEPCCHENKKTPPCAQFLLERGIKNVVIGMTDPNPAVAGKGIELLRKNGVNVVTSVLLADCLRLNRGFVSLQTKHRPWLTHKKACTSDWCFANPDGSKLKITSQQQDTWSHTFLRAKHDAILVGIGTILKDNPRLDIRFKDNPPPLTRIIFDAHLQIPLSATVVGDAAAKRTIIVHGTSLTSDDAMEKKRVLAGRGVRLLEIPVKNGVFDWNMVWKTFMTPTDDFHGIASILVEGGAVTRGHFVSAGLMDEDVTLMGA